ncbi:MAG TPA: hypothetical protein PKD83_03855 [Ignavibacteria bacterium]|nr:hypothetical protein [Ignavibacteria bacterium]
MKNKSKLQLVFTLLVMLFFTAGSFAKNIPVIASPDYSGTWDFYFYDTSDKVVGAKTLLVKDDGTISAITNVYIDNFVYDTRISAIVSANGKVSEGEMIYLTKQENVGSFTGSFSDAGGSGTWKNYMGKSGTWKATRSDKKIKE